MQHYVNIGFGFSGSLLTPAQADAIWDQTDCQPGKGDVGLWLVPFTEGYEVHDWSTVVVKCYG